MKSLQEFINESNISSIFENQLPGSKTIIKIYKEIFGEEYYSKCGNKSLKGDTKHVHELFRGFLGENDNPDNVIENTNKFFQYIGLSKNDYNLEYEFDPEASGQYPSVKVTFNKDIKTEFLSCNKDYYVFIVNTCGKVKRKELTPASLGVADKDFKSSNEVKEIIAKTTQKNEYNAILVKLFDDLTVKDEVKKETLDEILNEDIKFDNIEIGSLDKKTLTTVLVDFGEVIGGCYLLNTLKGEHTLRFPGKSNLKNVDYFIDYKEIKTEEGDIVDASTISISAKADKGAAPSCVSMAQSIIHQVKSGLIDANNEFIKNIIPALATLDKGKNNSSIITCQNKLFNFLSTKDNTPFKDVMKLLEDNNLYSQKDEAFNLDNIKKMINDDKELFYNIIKNVYDKLNYHASDQFSIEGGVSCKLFDNFDKAKDLYYGCLAYPIRAKIVEYLNTNYSDDISMCCKLGLGYYQIYVKFGNFEESKTGNRCSIIFTLKKLDKEDHWKFEPSGSVNNPKLKSIACRPK